MKQSNSTISPVNVSYRKICELKEIPQDSGVCALVDNKQIAIFKISPDDKLYAISNHDPFSKANVLSRGIVGAKCGTPKVASPIYKQQFDLTNGRCIDNSNVTVPTYPICLQDGYVYISSEEQSV